MNAPQRVSARQYQDMVASLGGRPKYGNTKVEVDGVMFDSKLEARHWQQLQLRQRAGEIHDLRRQVPYDLVVNGVKVCRLVADYAWLDATGTPVTADAKGRATRDWLTKAKLFKALMGREVVVLK